MNAGSNSLPLPAGRALAGPMLRVPTRVVKWDAPNPAALVLDPWAAPVGAGIVRMSVSPWHAPVTRERIMWMAAPVSLHPAPDLYRTIAGSGTTVPRFARLLPPVMPPEVAALRQKMAARAAVSVVSFGRADVDATATLIDESTANAIAALRRAAASAATIERVEPTAPTGSGALSLAEPTIDTLAEVGTIDPLGKPATGWPPPVVKAAPNRWRIAAIAAGAGAAVAAVATLVASLL